MKLKSMIRESHERQFKGEDFQAVAIGIATGAHIEFESDEYKELMSAPDPGCDCGFCASAPWED